MRDRKDGIYLVLAWLAERLPDGSQVRREIAERSPLTQIRQASAGERLNTDNLTGEAARTYRDIIGVVGYAEPFLAGDERVVIANYVSDFAIDDGFGLHTAEQHPSFVERLGEEGLPNGSLDWLLCEPQEAATIERIARETFDRATLELQNRLVVRAPEWWPDGPVSNVSGDRVIECRICRKLYPREPFVTGPLACSLAHAQNVAPDD